MSRGFQLRGCLKRAAQEARYATMRRWSLAQVGEFWDSVTEYEDVNREAYPHFRRFTDSFRLAQDLIPKGVLAVECQARTGNGSRFWAEQGYIRHVHVVDFSPRMLEAASANLRAAGVSFQAHLVNDLPFPLAGGSFDLALCYETIEHIWDRQAFLEELARLLRPGGWMILTCPNPLWEPVHWLSAIFNLHHSEGPHRFPLRRTLVRLFAHSGLQVVREKSTVLLPFSWGWSTRMDSWLEKRLPKIARRYLALRRLFVLRKGEGSPRS